VQCDLHQGCLTSTAARLLRPELAQLGCPAAAGWRGPAAPSAGPAVCSVLVMLPPPALPLKMLFLPREQEAAFLPLPSADGSFWSAVALSSSRGSNLLTQRRGRLNTLSPEQQLGVEVGSLPLALPPLGFAGQTLTLLKNHASGLHPPLHRYSPLSHRERIRG